MTIRIDVPPDGGDDLIDGAIASRISAGNPLGLKSPVSVTRPIKRRYYTVVGAGRPNFRFFSLMAWDYFVLSGNTIAMASLQQERSRLTFEGLLGGPAAHRLLAGVSIANRELAGQSVDTVLRIFECRAAKLLSVVVQPKTGRGRYLNVLDKTLVDQAALELVGDIRGLRDLAAKRLQLIREDPDAHRLL